MADLTPDDVNNLIQTYMQNYTNSAQYGVSKVPFHTHNGADSVPTSPNNVVGNLQSTGSPINVGLATPPLPGQVLTAVDATHATWQGAAVEISFDHSTAYGVGASPFNQNYTNAGNLLFVGVYCVTGDAAPTAISYNSVPMTLIASKAGSTTTTYLYYLRGPATGINNLSITFSGAFADTQSVMAASYFDCNVTSQPDNSATGSATTTAFSQSVTSVADNCWAIMVGSFESNHTATAGTGTIIRQENSFDSATKGAYLCDTGQAISPAQSITLNLLSSSQLFTGIIASFNPLT